MGNVRQLFNTSVNFSCCGKCELQQVMLRIGHKVFAIEKVTNTSSANTKKVILRYISWHGSKQVVFTVGAYANPDCVTALIFWLLERDGFDGPSHLQADS